MLYRMRGHSDTVTGMQLSPDGSYLLSNAMDNTGNQTQKEKDYGTRCLSTIALFTGPCSAVGRESDCRSRRREFIPGPVSYFRGD